MSDHEFNRLEKFMPYKAKTGRTYVQDSNLQLNSPHSKESPHTANAKAFNRLLSYYTKEMAHEQNQPINQDHIEHELSDAMEDAEQKFNSMMDISKQLRVACQDLIKTK